MKSKIKGKDLSTESDAFAKKGVRFNTKKFGILFRLMLVHAAVLIIALSVLSFEAVKSVNDSGVRNVKIELGNQITEFGSAVNKIQAGQTLSDVVRAYLGRHVLAAGEGIIVSLKSAQTYATVSAAPLASIPTIKALISKVPPSSEYLTINYQNTSYQVLASPIIGTSVDGVIFAIESLSQVTSVRNHVLLVTVVEATLVLIIALGSTFFVLRRLLRVIARMTQTAREISTGDLNKRIDYSGPKDELGTLAETFDEMIVRLGNAMDAQRSLLSDVSHQLKTPLTVIQGHVEVLTRGDLSDPSETRQSLDLVRDEVGHASALVEQLLLLGRSLEVDFIEPGIVDLRSFISDIWASVPLLAERVWRLGDIPDLTLMIDSERMNGAIRNLIDNAIHATKVGDTICLEVVKGDYIDFKVVDTGHGMTPGQVENARVRFSSGAERQKKGTGLGLAIVDAIAKAHGGQVVIDSKVGEGTSVSIRIPFVKAVNLNEDLNES